MKKKLEKTVKFCIKNWKKIIKNSFRQKGLNFKNPLKFADFFFFCLKKTFSFLFRIERLREKCRKNDVLKNFYLIFPGNRSIVQIFKIR